MHLKVSASFLVILAVSMTCLAVGRGPFLLVGATLMVCSESALPGPASCCLLR
jgi:hypothetical protein